MLKWGHPWGWGLLGGNQLDPFDLVRMSAVLVQVEMLNRENISLS